MPIRTAEVPSANSHYGTPLDFLTDAPRGRSRDWGDVGYSEQRLVIDRLVTESTAQGLNTEQTALVLATAFVESGFNPDAASKTQSAAGIGQFIDRTAESLGVTNESRFSLAATADKMVWLVKDSIRLGKYFYAEKEDYDALTYGYAVYHDGPMLGAGGLEIAREAVMPKQIEFKEWLSANESAIQDPQKNCLELLLDLSLDQSIDLPTADSINHAPISAVLDSLSRLGFNSTISNASIFSES